MLQFFTLFLTRCSKLTGGGEETTVPDHCMAPTLLNLENHNNNRGKIKK